MSQNPREFYASHSPGRILDMHIPFGSMVKFQCLAQFLMDHLPYTVMFPLTLLLRKFALFTYPVSNRFVSITTKSRLIILLRIINFGFNFTGHYYFTPLRVFTPTLADGFSLEFERQQLSTSL